MNDVQTTKQQQTHNDEWCPKYNDQVLPDEAGDCSLCGARIVSEFVEMKPYKHKDGTLECPSCQEELAGNGKNELECMNCNYSIHESNL